MTFVEVSDGVVDPARIVSAVRDNTCLVTCIMANNETGVIQVRLFPDFLKLFLANFRDSFVSLVFG